MWCLPRRNAILEWKQLKRKKHWNLQIWKGGTIKNLWHQALSYRIWSLSRWISTLLFPVLPHNFWDGNVYSESLCVRIAFYFFWFYKDYNEDIDFSLRRHYGLWTFELCWNFVRLLINLKFNWIHFAVGYGHNPMGHGSGMWWFEKECLP